MSKTLPRYALIELDGEEMWCVRIGSGPYANVIYKYNHVRVIEPQTDSDNATLKYNYEVLYHAEQPESKFAKNHVFETLIGDILYELIMSFEEKQKDDQPK